jgi:hypothetical protein
MTGLVTIAPDSGFWTHGRLSPYSATRFNVQQASAAPDVKIEVFADGIAVWSWPGATLARSVEDARDLMGLVTAAYTVRSAFPLDFTFTGWVEATHASFDGTMVGFTVPRGHKPDMDESGKRSRHMAAAIDLAVAVFERGPWRLAVRDVHAAYLALATRSDDVFVFANRAVEDLAHAVSTTGRKSWSDLHTHLGTTETNFKRRTKALREARDAVVHGDANGPALVAARPKIKALVGLARSIVREAIAREPTLPNL